MTGVKICLVSAMGVAVTDMIPDNSGIVFLLSKGGVVALLVAAIVAIYKDGRKRQDKLEEIIESNASSNMRLADAANKQADATFQMSATVKEVIVRCHDHKAGPAPEVPKVPSVR